MKLGCHELPQTFTVTKMNELLSERITINPEICHGKPCIRGLRYPVETILEWLSSGMKFLIDAQLSRHLAATLKWNSLDTLHTLDLPLGNNIAIFD